MCRPGERRDPYAVQVRLEDAVETFSYNHEHLWLWVPAFAGTTLNLLCAIALASPAT